MGLLSRLLVGFRKWLGVGLSHVSPKILGKRLFAQHVSEIPRLRFWGCNAVLGQKGFHVNEDLPEQMLYDLNVHTRTPPMAL